MKATLVTCLAMQLSLSVGCVAGADGDDSVSSDEEPISAEPIAQFGRGHVLPNGVPFRNASGYAATVSTAGSIDLSNEFFQDLGTNGRRCVSCHQPATGWTVTPEGLRQVFERTRGG